jgi:hypothetical protein
MNEEQYSLKITSRDSIKSKKEENGGIVHFPLFKL